MWNFQKKKAKGPKRVRKPRADGCTCKSKPHRPSCPARTAAKPASPPPEAQPPQQPRQKRQRCSALTPPAAVADDLPALARLAQALDVPVPDRALAELAELDQAMTDRREWRTIDARKRRRIVAVAADVSRAVCKHVPVRYEEGPGSLADEVGARLATHARSADDSAGIAELANLRSFIVAIVVAHPQNSLEARQALASLAHEPWHVVRADVLKASDGQVAVSEVVFGRARSDRELLSTGVPLKPEQLSPEKKRVEVVESA